MSQPTDDIEPRASRRESKAVAWTAFICGLAWGAGLMVILDMVVAR